MSARNRRIAKALGIALGVALAACGGGGSGADGASGANGANGADGGGGGPGANGASASGLIDVTSLGAKGDGAADDTAALAGAAGKYAALFFPAGVYVVDGLTLRANTLVVAAPGAILRGKPGGTAPVLTLASGDRIDGLEIDGNVAARPSSAICVLAKAAPHVTLTHLFAHDCKAAGVSIESSDDTVIESSRFERCQAACVDVVFSNRTRVSDGALDTCKHGIQWWGGDSATADTPNLSDLTITGNVVKNVAGGCIWGSDGVRVTVSGNTVLGCGDVGIDLEGTSHGSVTGNSVTNATNAGISTFYGSSDVTIAGNTIDQTNAASGPGIKLFGTKPSHRIVISGNSVATTSAIGLTMDQGIASDLTIEGNVIATAEAVAAIRTLDAESVVIVGNHLSVGGPTGIALEGTSDSIVSNNVITSSGDSTTTPGDHGGIFMPWRSAGFPTKRNEVQGNEIAHFSTSINDDCWGDVASANDITGNRVDGAIYRRAGAGWNGNVSGNQSLTNPTTTVDVQTY